MDDKRTGGGMGWGSWGGQRGVPGWIEVRWSKRDEAIIRRGRSVGRTADVGLYVTWVVT